MYEEGNTNEVRNNDVSVGEWIISTIVMMVPIVNIVMMFVWAFGSNTKPSKANYFKAALLMTAIGVVLSILTVTLFGAAIFGALGSVYGY